jgi:hypothetical protein
MPPETHPAPAAPAVSANPGTLAAAILAAAPAGERLLASAGERLTQLGLAGRLRVPLWTQGRFSQHTDPASGRATLRADFFSAGGQRKGHLLFHGDGSHYGEIEVGLTHPKLPSWWIEVIEIWGRDGTVKNDLRLLALPAEET